LRDTIRALVVDDSRFARRWIIRALEDDPGIHVVGVAGDGREGLARVADLQPDVITLDVEMPVRDGLAMLRELMSVRPTPVVMVSSTTTSAAAVTLEALAMGAIDFVTKPSADPADLERAAAELRERVRIAASMTQAQLTRARSESVEQLAPEAAGTPTTDGAVASRLVVMCCSTGGPTALRAVVPRLPTPLGAAVVIVQHMPAGFTAALASRLDVLSTIAVQEATDGQRLTDDRVVVAPGDRHMVISADGTVRLSGLPRVNGVRPSADVTLQSVAAAWGERLLAVVMTGIGADGREGARAIRANGGRVIGQDEASSLVHGMPRAVIDAGLADQVLGLEELPAAIAGWIRSA
jgi:two-component system chemotaxis response regulator CheB